MLMKSVTQKMTATKLEGSRIEKVFSLTPKKAKSKAAASAPKAAASAEAARIYKFLKGPFRNRCFGGGLAFVKLAGLLPHALFECTRARSHIDVSTRYRIEGPFRMFQFWNA